MDPLNKMYFLLKMVVFHCYVSLPAGEQSFKLCKLRGLWVLPKRNDIQGGIEPTNAPNVEDHPMILGCFLSIGLVISASPQRIECENLVIHDLVSPLHKPLTTLPETNS